MRIQHLISDGTTHTSHPKSLGKVLGVKGGYEVV